MSKQNLPTYESNPFKVIFRGFEKIFDINPTWSIIIIVFGLLSSGGNSFSNMGGHSNGNVSSSFFSSGVIIALVVLGVFLFVAAIVITVLFRGAVAYVTVKTIKGERAGVGEALGAAWSKFWSILYIQVIVGLKVLGGLLLFIVPGVRAALRYNMALLPLFADQPAVNGTEAMKSVKILTKSHLIEVFGMVTASGIIPIIGSLLGVGGQIVMFPQLKELKASGAPKPKVHWLNYLGFILLGFLVLLIALAAALFASYHK